MGVSIIITKFRRQHHDVVQIKMTAYQQSSPASVLGERPDEWQEDVDQHTVHYT